MEQIAEQFAVSSRTMRVASAVNESASEGVKKALEDGSISLNKAINAVKQAAAKTSITITKETSDKDRKTAHEAQDRIIAGKAISRSSDKPAKKTSAQQFQDRVLFDEFDSKRWHRNLADMQSSIQIIERIPSLYEDCFDLLKEITNEALLRKMCNLFLEVNRKLKGQLQRNETNAHTSKGISEIQKFFANIQARNFPELDDDFGAGDKMELCKELRKKIIGNCDKAEKGVIRIMNKLQEKHE
jgi:hypothetical protein